VKNTLKAYRVLAWIVGTLIIILYVAVALKYLTTDGTDIQKFGSDVTSVVGLAHGWLYMVYLVLVAVLARNTRWSIPFTITTLLVGLVPFATFWAERRATRLVRAKFPETVASGR
jgi:integral membrane protein